MIGLMQEPGLDLVISALERLRDGKERTPCASRAALERLLVTQPVSAPLVPPSSVQSGSKIERLAPVRERVRVCTKCPHLACSRTQTVFGVGNPDAEIMFIGEAPGADEDAQGEPFVGRAGQLLTKIIETMGFARGDVYIANILKCRPDTPRGSFGNRAPTPLEMQTCRPYLVEQIDIIQPKVLVALGAVAVEGLLGARGRCGICAGRWHSYQETPFDDYLSSRVSAAEPIAVGKTESLGRHPSSAGAAGTTDHRKTAQLFFVLWAPRRACARSNIASIFLRDASVTTTDEIIERYLARNLILRFRVFRPPSRKSASVRAPIKRRQYGRSAHPPISNSERVFHSLD